MQTKEEAFSKLERSAFRNSFHLSRKEKDYVKEKGMEVIRQHAVAFVENRLAPAEPKNDGRQTPWQGHPVFVAQHACACCCRGCLEKWYKVAKGKRLTDLQQQRIVNFLLAWIGREMEKQEEKDGEHQI